MSADTATTVAAAVIDDSPVDNAPRWLVDVLLACEGSYPSAEMLAGRIIEALPLQAIAAAIRDSAGCVLERGMRDGRSAESLAKEIGNNASQTVAFALAGLLDD